MPEANIWDEEARPGALDMQLWRRIAGHARPFTRPLAGLAVSGLVIAAGGPHVQQAEDYLGIDPIDVIFLGEAEISFQEFLDCGSPAQWWTSTAWPTSTGHGLSPQRRAPAVRTWSAFPRRWMCWN